MEKAGKLVPMKNHNPRSRNWVRARTPAFTPEGNVVFKDQKLQEVAVKMNNIVTQQQARTFVPDRDRDKLTYALGKPEHSGCVRGVSSKTSGKDGFKQDAHTYKKQPEPSYPFDDVTEDTPCKLLIPVGRAGKKILVATGRFIPGRRFHCQDIPDDYVKVEVRTVIEAYRMHELDFPTTEQIVYLGDVVDQFILWHKNDIELGSTDAIDRLPRIPVSPSRPPVVASPRDSSIASPPRPEPPVASPPGPEPPVASPPRPEPPVASPRIEKDAEEQSVLAKQQSQLAIREMSPA
uniref:Transposon protein, putative, CACTA, En/Spm sub-class n=2 Tax=Oryza sativa subsp. japonica TaxID=39947 RepID=Q53N11_ORYSJ|nr:transposon protein, putative, CACTA, En/Spm sub-class [Oryza sativa Japonica Group]ABA92440.1 transposon protein, putative, CACTA, En/Spm sub-class [Oryza sativa Japonica Group]